jgi:AcrR family transcriptional regulator
MPKIQRPNIVTNREFRRQQLITAAMELAVAGGAESITVGAVAQKAGLARSSIYEYFASSADLVAELVLEELDYYTMRLASAIGEATDPYQKIELWIAESLRYVADGRHMLIKSLNTINTPDSRREEIAIGHRRMLAPLHQSLIETGIADTRGASAFLASVTDAASIRIDAGNDAGLEINNAVTFALAGIRALAQNGRTNS